ncbi:MAG TPA: class I SAM-dependent methyltransferase [Tepidisphaeraceae bacterium]|jgi:hypothetical protein
MSALTPSLTPANSPSAAHRSKAPNCPVCQSSSTYAFYRQDNVPAQDGIIWPTRQEAIDAPRGDIDLIYCPACSHIFNHKFDVSRFLFNATYDISLHHSPTYQKFIEELTAGLVERHDLRGKTIVELGCGKADFLKGICEPFGNRGIGFDPTFIDSNLTDAQRKLIEVHPRYYTADDQRYQGDFLTFRSMLQYFRDPRTWLDTFRGSVKKPGGVIYAEVPNGAHTFAQLCIWNIVYEHGCFYSRQSLTKLFEEMGYFVQNCFPCFVEDQNLGIEAGIAPSARKFAFDPAEVDAYTEKLEAFVAEHARITAHWRETLDELLKQGKRMALWGAGARAISFCTLFDLTDESVPYIVDINPKRQGNFLPRTLQKVVAPEHLLADKPDVIIITNSGYAAEIRQQISEMGLLCDVMVL